MSSLSEADIIKIAHEIKGHTMSDGQRLADSVLKILIVLCTAGIIWIANAVNNLIGQQIRMDEWRIVSMEQQKTMKMFMQEPRFSEAMFDHRTKPMFLDIESNRRGIQENMRAYRELNNQILLMDQDVNRLKAASHPESKASKQ